MANEKSKPGGQGMDLFGIMFTARFYSLPTNIRLRIEDVLALFRFKV